MNETITWSTDVASTSEVEWGTTTAYGSTSGVDPRLVTSHSVTLTGLASGTLYHYRVRSIDASGVETIGTDQTFSTLGVANLYWWMTGAF